MDSEKPGRPDDSDGALDRLQDLAERVAAEIAERVPDWCGIAAWARELAVVAGERCEDPPPSGCSGKPFSR